MSKLNEKLEKKLKDLGYNYYGDLARKYYKGFELKIEFSKDLSISKTSVDIELYGPMYDEIEKERDEAREIIKNDVEVLKEFIIKNQKTRSTLEEKLAELGYKSYGDIYYIGEYDNHIKKSICIENNHVIKEYSGIEITQFVIFEDENLDYFIQSMHCALYQLQKDLKVLKEYEKES